MRDPLGDDVVTTLKTDKCAALAAALILAGSFPELLAWAQRTIGTPAAKTNGAGNGVAESGNLLPAPVAGSKSVRAPGEATKGARAKGRHNSREGAAKHDQTLLALMWANPAANVTEIIRLNGRPRNSTVLSLERLQKAGLVEHARWGKWTVVDPELVEGPAPKPAGWIEPLSGARVARHAADGRVRDELTLAAGAH